MAEDEKTPLKNLIFQILIACVIPIIGGWIVVGILYVKFSQDGAVTVIEPSYAPSKSVSNCSVLFHMNLYMKF